MHRPTCLVLSKLTFQTNPKLRFAGAAHLPTSRSATARTTMQSGQMTVQSRQIDEAAFGVVYGSITVMALLAAMRAPIEAPGRNAALLFGTVLVVALAKAYAEICARMLASGNAATWPDVTAVWRHSRTVLLASNGPTLAFLFAALGLYGGDTALFVAQLLAFGLLGWFGGRIGWRESGRVSGVFVGAAATLGLGVLITTLKVLIH